jgi:uncharacterized protein YqjF (DUF2071 family)
MMTPTLENRLRMRERPEHRTPVMFEKWENLLFLHWEYDPQAIQQTLPNGLYVDTFDGKAYLGIIPFLMRSIRPRLFPPALGISGFEELNVRTYVYDRTGMPGVWFYSLDANHYLAGILARLFFNLPYFHANMTAEFRPDQKEISFSSYRHGTDPRFRTQFRYRARSAPSVAIPGTLEFFLIERYVLFAYSKRHKLYAGRVWHPPYELADAEVTHLDENVLSLDGFRKPSSDAFHKIASQGVAVEIFGFEELSQGDA